eukprot:scaffold101770_cov28-Tisochrysis_lutea.AAC.4
MTTVPLWHASGQASDPGARFTLWVYDSDAFDDSSACPLLQFSMAATASFFLLNYSHTKSEDSGLPPRADTAPTTTPTPTPFYPLISISRLLTSLSVLFSVFGVGPCVLPRTRIRLWFGASLFDRRSSCPTIDVSIVLCAARGLAGMFREVGGLIRAGVLV